MVKIDTHGLRRRAPRAEILTVGAVAHIKGEAHHGHQHGVNAVEQLAIDDGVEADVGRDVRRAPGVPTKAMTVFGGLIHRTAFGCQRSGAAAFAEALGHQTTPAPPPWVDSQQLKAYSSHGCR